MRSIAIGALAALVVGAVEGMGAEAKEPSLSVGDPAPKLQVSKWVQGEPVKEFEAGKVYIVEFWATWCGPCRTSIPHLNEIHEKFKDKGLVVIGQDVWENDVGAVPKFVKDMGDKMTYRVALDQMEGSERGKMAETWMMAAGQGGIPAAFLINKQGRIAWIGHPMTLKPEMIEEVLAGTFDIEKAAEAHRLRLKNEAQLNTLWRKVSTSLREEKWEEAETGLSEMQKLLPEDQRAGLDVTRFQMLMGKKDYPGAYKLARRISDAHEDNPALQNQLAWGIATTKDPGESGLALAETMATRANKATEGKDAAILDTLARVKFMQGEKEKAIELQKAAVERAEGPGKQQLQSTLESYKKDKLPGAE